MHPLNIVIVPVIGIGKGLVGYAYVVYLRENPQIRQKAALTAHAIATPVTRPVIGENYQLFILRHLVN